eukprot:2680849-Rhodomonas_salina.2
MSAHTAAKSNPSTLAPGTKCTGKEGKRDGSGLPGPPTASAPVRGVKSQRREESRRKRASEEASGESESEGTREGSARDAIP